jgi:glyoxylase-like metal-dependent hydrolase (beta-lactamase superfamily II)
MSKIHVLDLNFLNLPHTIASFLIESSEGPVLIETGPHSTIQVMEKGLQEYGYRIEDIKHVFLSHIHLDHAGAAWVFAEHGAKIYLHPFGAKNMEDPTRLMESATRIYGDKMDQLWGQMKKIPSEQLIEVGDQEVIQIGDVSLKSLHTPGHAKHHIAWQLGDAIFTGDVAGVKIDAGIVVPPCPPPDINIEDWKNSIELIRSLNPKKLYLTHFDKIENINEHLNSLETILDNWAAWIKEHWEAGETNEAMVPKFMAHVAGQLREVGLTESDIQLYEAANPSWMSVAGLVRYWKKKSDIK